MRTSLSGLTAASESMSARADNIVNARSAAPLDKVDLHGGTPAEGVFRSYRVANLSVRGGGVETELVPIRPSHRAATDPDDPSADAEGRVALPNVSHEEEIVGMMQDRTAWEANLVAMRAADEMAGYLLDEET